MVPWYHGAMVPWYHGTMVTWHLGTMGTPSARRLPGVAAAPRRQAGGVNPFAAAVAGGFTPRRSSSALEGWGTMKPLVPEMVNQQLDPDPDFKTSTRF